PVAQRTPTPVAHRTPTPVAQRTPTPVAQRTPTPVAQRTPTPTPTHSSVVEAAPAAASRGGSGTLAIEGAQWARRIAPGLARECFGAERWASHDATQADVIDTLRDDFRACILPASESPDVLATVPGTHPDRERGLDDRQYIVPGAGGLGELLNNAWI
ncbi:MAG: hypothetical protein WCJ30_03005, partial [Deltaproteobacteria bacterium]